MENNFLYFDICIVGASIAGNYLCYLLSNLNLKVVVIEEHTEIGRPFQCAGIVSQKLSKLIDLPEEIVLNRVNTAKIVAASGKYIKLSGNERPFVIDRVALDKLFYNKTKNSKNVSYLLGEKFKSFNYIVEQSKKSLIIKTSKREIKCKILIGCDGPLSLIAKSVGIKKKIIYGAQIRIIANFNKDEAVLFFDSRWKELIGWIVPEGRNKIYRIGVASAKNVSENLKTLIKKLNIDQTKKIDQQGGIIPYGFMNKLAFDNILLLGDAAGQVKATTGGGIVMLLIAAKYATYCIAKCFKSNKFSKRFIKKNYEKPCYAIVGKELKLHYALRKIFENFTSKDFENLFQIVKKNHRIEQLISLFGDMDFPKSLILQLLKNLTIIKFIIQLIIKKPILFFKLVKLLLI